MWSCHVEKTIGFLLTHWWWMSQWLMTTMDVRLSVQTEHSHTECPPLELLNLTVFWTIRTEKRYDIIVTYTLIDLTPSSFCQSSSALRSCLWLSDFVRLLFLYTHCEASILTGELPEESEQFRFLRVGHLENLKDSVGLIHPKPPQWGLLFPSICLHVLSYFYLDFLTLVEHLPFLLHLWFYFRK